MKILVTGTLQSFADKKETAVLESARKAKEGAVTETFYLRFHSPEAYADFKTRYRPGDGIQVIGLVRQVQVPLLDRQTKAPLVGTTGRELRNALLAVEVREHKPQPASADGFDTIYVHGLVGIVEKRELRASASGLNVLKLRVAYNHFKRHDEPEGQADFYDMVAFGARAESLDNMDKGDRLLIDHAVLTSGAYEMRDLTHADGTPVTRNGPEMTLRDFSFLPRQRAESRSGEEIPF